jgi:hypothetical protein
MGRIIGAVRRDAGWRHVQTHRVARSFFDAAAAFFKGQSCLRDREGLCRIAKAYAGRVGLKPGNFC